MYRRRQLNTTQAPAAGEDLLTADEVAELLRMTPAWVYAETRRNRIPHIRLGRYCRYRRAAIETWMCDLEMGPGPGRLRSVGAETGTPGQSRRPPSAV
jgi:excisionase family DNA binding protein